jgi:hypothetical protein
VPVSAPVLRCPARSSPRVCPARGVPLLLPLCFLLAAAAPAPPVVPSHPTTDNKVAPRLEKPHTLRELAQAEPVATVFSGTRLCLVVAARSHAITVWVAKTADAPAESFEVTTDPVSDAGRREEACGPDFVRFAALATALCRDIGKRLPFDDWSLAWHPSEEARARLEPWPTRAPSYWDGSQEMGCGRFVTSSDGRARIWVTQLETLTDTPESLGARRGRAWMQWRSSTGEVVTTEASADLHLDTVIDAIDPLPGARPLWLVMGLRAYVGTYVGTLPRRYAWVLHLGDDARIQVDDAFGARAPLLLRATKLPEDSRFREDPLAHRRLVFDPGSAELRLVGVDRPAEPSVVAHWAGTRFVVQGTAFGDIARADGWAKKEHAAKH